MDSWGPQEDITLIKKNTWRPQEVFIFVKKESWGPRQGFTFQKKKLDLPRFHIVKKRRVGTFNNVSDFEKPRWPQLFLGLPRFHILKKTVGEDFTFIKRKIVGVLDEVSLSWKSWDPVEYFTFLRKSQLVLLDGCILFNKDSWDLREGLIILKNGQYVNQKKYKKKKKKN